MGSEFDLMNKANVIVLWKFLASCAFGHFGPPCTSFSLARRGKAPRSRQFPLGKPGLSENDRWIVHVGNTLMHLCERGMQFLYERGTPGSLEQPNTCRMWLCRSMVRALHKTNSLNTNIVMCKFGTPWRK